MKEILNNQINVTEIPPVSSTEMDSIPIIRKISEEGFRTGWVPGKNRTTKETIAREREALMREKEQVAAATEYE